MADVRYKNDTVIVDPTTPTQQLAIDASGRASVSLTASSATVTVDSEMPAAAALADAAANPTTPTVGAANLVFNGTTWDRLKESVAALDSTGTGIPTAGIMGQFDDTSTSTVTENNFAHVRISSRRALLIEGVASGTAVTVSLTSTTITGTVTVDTELPAAAALADGTANPTTSLIGSLLEGFNGTTWDRLKTLDALDAAPNVRTGVLAVGVGPGFDVKFNPSNLATATNSAITNTVDGADEVTYAIGTTTSGTYTFEVSGDDSTWVAAQFYNKQTNAVASGNITPTSGDVYAVRVSGWRQVRVRVVSTLGATMAVKTTHTVAPTDPSAGIFAALADAVANPTVVSQGAYLIGYNGTTWDRLRSSTANGLVVDVSRVQGTVTVDSELPAAAALTSDAVASPTAPAVGSFAFVYNGATWDRARGAAALADALANPGTGLAQNQVFLMGYNGTTWDRVKTANTGRLQVDVITGGSTDTPTNPIVKTVTISALAAGSSSTTELRTVDLGGTTKKLTKIQVWGSVAFKADLQTVANGAGTSVFVGGAAACATYTHEPPGGRTGRNYYSVAHPANAGFDGWQIIVTNLDASEAADFYAVIEYED